MSVTIWINYRLFAHLVMFFVSFSFVARRGQYLHSPRPLVILNDLSLRLKLSTSKLFQLVRNERHDMNKLLALRTSRYVFYIVLFCSPPRSFFCLNNLRKVRKRCSHSIISFQAIILDIFDRNVAQCFILVFRLLWAGRPSLPLLHKAMNRGHKKNSN